MRPFLRTMFGAACIAAAMHAWGQHGDIAIWIPNPDRPSATAAQVIRNGEYISVKLQSVFAYYHSGFLENISNLVVASSVSFHNENRLLEGMQVNKVWQRIDEAGDFIGINDHLAVLSPTTPLSVKIKVSFRGIGEDRFKSIFEMLDSSALKTALDLSPVTLGRLSAVTPLVQKMLASPYTSGNPRQILDVEQSFVLYSRGTGPKDDALREGHYVVISAREGRSADLSKLQTLGPADIRLSSLGIGIEYKEGGRWVPLSKNSYVVISVNRASVRGEDEGAAWFKKYNEAVAAAEKVIEGLPVDQAKQASLTLWREGSALLAAEANYVQREKTAIRSDWLSRINKTLGAHDDSGRIQAHEHGLPSNYEQIALMYRAELSTQWSTFLAKIYDFKGNAIKHKRFALVGQEKSQASRYLAISDTQGQVSFERMRPGMYVLEPLDSTGGAVQTTQGINVVLEPREVRMVEIQSREGVTPWVLKNSPSEPPTEFRAYQPPSPRPNN